MSSNNKIIIIYFFNKLGHFYKIKIWNIPLLIRNLLTLKKIGINNLYIWLKEDNKVEINNIISTYSNQLKKLKINIITELPKNISKNHKIILINGYILLKISKLKEILELQEEKRTKDNNIIITSFKNIYKCKNFLEIEENVKNLPLIEDALSLGPIIDNFKNNNIYHKIILEEITSPLEGYIDKYFNRPLGRLILPLFIKLNIHPNIVSIISILIGVIGALLFLYPKHKYAILGIILIQFSAILDCIDGDIARLSFKETKLGKWLDITGDNIVHLILFITISLREYNRLNSIIPLILGLSLGIGTIISFFIVIHYQKLLSSKYNTKVNNSKKLEKLETLLSNLTSRDFFFLILIGALINNFIWFLWLSGIGVHIFWILFLVWILINKG